MSVVCLPPKPSDTTDTYGIMVRLPAGRPPRSMVVGLYYLPQTEDRLDVAEATATRLQWWVDNMFRTMYDGVVDVAQLSKLDATRQDICILADDPVGMHRLHLAIRKCVDDARCAASVSERVALWCALRKAHGLDRNLCRLTIAHLQHEQRTRLSDCNSYAKKRRIV